MEQRLADPVVRAAYENIVPISWLDADPDEIAEIGRKRHEKFCGDADERLNRLAECGDPALCERHAWRVTRDGMLRSGDWLRSGTGLDSGAFFYLVSRLEEGIRGNPEAPLFRYGVDEDRASDRGNRCILAVEHMLCMVLYRVWTGCSQAALQGPFGVDQATASRNIRVVMGILANTGILPTGRAVAGEIAAAPRERALEAVGGVINADWTHIEIEKPVDRDSNNEAYSHKADATTCKMMGWCTAPGLIIHTGPALGGRGSEIEYLRRFVPALGHVTASLTDPCTPEGERITVHFDGGPQGSGEVLAGADVLMPYRRPPKGELTEEQLDYNSWLAGERAIIENNFADIKAHRILANVFRGSVADLEEAFSVVSGLVNLKRIMRGVRGWTPDTHRKRLKPGPKTPGPRGRKPLKTFERKE